VSSIEPVKESCRVTILNWHSGSTSRNADESSKWINGSDKEGDLSMNAKPLHDRVVLKRIEETQTVKGGIIIPDTAKGKPLEGEVIAVGPGKIMADGKRSPMDAKPGDRVLIGKYAGTEINIDDEEYVIMREEEILAVLAKGK
jgi:chaperonin GroES